ncbi:transportin-2-like [Rhipicephalus sanguineus]|uniref:transportin-2-like n=1 Tax=Rhipicephalus sanguineus TaxID=34632 RepID=UPI001895FA3E|nr:transportin-2-like [Rhipicephalus sanguineus]
MISSRSVGFQFVEKSDPLSSVWEPQERRLWKIVKVLKDSLSYSETRSLTAERKVKKLGECADFNNYMVYILTALEFQYEAAPKRGELVLRKYASARSGALPLRVTVHDPLVLITAALGYFIMTQSEIDLTQWPELLPRLGELLDLQDDRICHDTLAALHKICRNFVHVMNAHQPHDQLTVLVPKCLRFIQHRHPGVRYNAVAFIGLLFLKGIQAAMPQADAFVRRLLMLGFDKDCKVHKQVCHVLAILLAYHVDRLVPYMFRIVEYVMIRMKDRNEDVALKARAALAFMAKPICKEALTPHFSNLVHNLVQGTKCSYSATERLEEEEPGTPRRLGSTRETRDDVNFGLFVPKKDNVFSEENMRSRSAFALRAISRVFNEELLTLLLPRLRQMLQDKDWVIMESGIFVLGVIAEGCMEDMDLYLPDLILFLIPIRSDRAAVRCTACWTLSRYYPWVLTKPQHLYLSPLVRQLLKWVLDDNEMVQEVACNALMTLEEKAKTSIVPYVDSILNTLHIGLIKYRRSRFYMLYNAIEILADSDATPCHPIICVLFSGGWSWGSAAEYSSLAMPSWPV